MLINLRNALMAGKRLPYDAEVEYLESTGAQWIDTGYSFNSATDKVELVFELLTTTPNYKWIFGAYDSSKRFAIGSGDNANRRTFGYNASTSYYSSTYYTDGAHILLADSTGASIDGHKFFGFADFSTTSHIILYSIPIDAPTFCSNARIWSYKHYRNGVLVRDFIPVRKGTVGYLYDRVSGKLFGNAGTGDFVLGSDVVPVEYIESHGTEYIDTGFIPGLNFHIDVRGRKAGDYSANAAIFSNEGVNSYVDCYYNAGWAMRCYGNGMAKPIYGGWFDAGIDFDFTSSPTTTFHLNSEEATATTSKTEAQITGSTKSVRLFQGMYGKTNPVDIVFFNADKNGQPALRLSAVRVGTEGAMMDVLTRRVYRNAGTGAFTYGNDLKYPIPAS